MVSDQQTHKVTVATTPQFVECRVTRHKQLNPAANKRGPMISAGKAVVISSSRCHAVDM